MSLNINIPVVNPRLGANYAAFTSSFICLILLLMILDQLGLSREHTGILIVALPVVTYLAMGIAARTLAVDDYFQSGQRVPAIYNGLALTAGSAGGVVVLSLTGAVFFSGLDAMAIGIGLCGGLALTAVFFASCLRKAGAYTLAGFFGLRFNSTAAQLIAAALVFVPSLMLLAAEIKLGALAAGYFLPLARPEIAMAGVAAAMAVVILGGMRSLTWTQCGQTIVVLTGIAIPVVWVSLNLTNLPVPQLTYGSVLKSLSDAEAAKGLVQTGQYTIAPDGLQQLTGSFAQLFGSLSPLNFALLTICVALGSAVLPAQIARLGTTPAIPMVRKSFSWAIVFTGLLVITLPAVAVFVKYFIVSEVSGAGDLPAWARYAQNLGMLKVSGDSLGSAFGDSRVMVNRDTVLLLLPIAGKLPFVFAGVMAAAACAAVLAAIAGHLVTMANSFSNDIYCAAVNRHATPARRLFMARLALVAAGIAGVWLASQPFDPLRMALRALSLNAGTFFAVLLLAVWWNRTPAIAAVMGMLAGFTMTAAIIFTAGKTGGINDLTVGAFGALIAAVTVAALSMISPAPQDETREFMDDLHLFAGETLLQKSQRQAAMGRARR